MTNYLDLTGLNDDLIDVHQYGFVANANFNSATGSFTVSGGNGDLESRLPAGSPPAASKPVSFVVKRSSYGSSVQNRYSLPVADQFSVLAHQSGGNEINGPTPPYGEVLTVLGWNADSILLQDATAGSPMLKYVIISSQDLNNGLPDDLTFAQSGPNPFNLAVVCFAEGTRITTEDGMVAVQDLAEGDLVLTVSGALQPVQWVGRREMQCVSHPQPARVMPVVVQAGAFGDGLPKRELILSPEHAVFVQGALVPVQKLINGATIRQRRVSTVTYYHVELPRHDVLFAEGLPTESYLDAGNRNALVRREAALAA